MNITEFVVRDRTETTAYLSDGKGNEAKYRIDLDSGEWEHENDVSGDLESQLEIDAGEAGIECVHAAIQWALDDNIQQEMSAPWTQRN